MPDEFEFSTPVALPAAPLAPLTDDAERTEIIAGATTIGEKIRSATKTALEKFHVVRRGRGRPKNDGSPKISDVVAPKVPATNGGGGVAVVDAAAEISARFNSPAHQLFRRIVAKAASSEIALLKGIVRVNGEAAGLDENFLNQALTAATPEPKAYNDVAESADYVAIKYGWNVERMPEIALGIDLLHLHAPFVTLFVAINAEIKRKRRAEKPTAKIEEVKK